MTPKRERILIEVAAWICVIVLTASFIFIIKNI